MRVGARRSPAALLVGAVALGFAFASACAPQPELPDAPDGAGLDAGGPPRLELGEGVPFRRIEDGDTLVLSRGSQGGQHVCVNMRAFAMVGRGMAVRLWITRDSDGARVTDEFTTRLSFYPPDAGGAAVDYVELPDLSLQFVFGDGASLPDGVLDTDLTLHGAITDRDGRMASEDRRVRVAWGENACSAFRIEDGGVLDGDVLDGGVLDGGVLDGGGPALDASEPSDAPPIG